MTETDVPEGRSESDDELRSLLREWHVVAPVQLERRVLKAYRRQVGRRGALSRAWHSRVALPVPVLAGLLVALGLGLFVARPKAPSVARGMAGPEPAAPVRIVIATRSLAGFRPISAAERLDPRTGAAR